MYIINYIAINLNITNDLNNMVLARPMSWVQTSKIGSSISIKNPMNTMMGYTINLPMNMID